LIVQGAQGDRDICPGVLEHRGQHEESGPARQHQRGVATGTSLIAVEDAGFAWIPTRCPLPAFLNALELRPPRLVFGQEFAPDDGEFLKLAAEACIACNARSVAELALLLGLAFPGTSLRQPLQLFSHIKRLANQTC
jgi:hypothetical protein